MAFTWRPPAEHARRLHEMLSAATARPGEADWYDVPAMVRKLYSDGVKAVVGYGSWYTHGLRKPTSFPDLYLIVDRYEQYHRSRFHAWMNRTLPPNVYFLWDDRDGRRNLRGKFNVISAADLERECSAALHDLYNAGRLTKLVWIAWARDEPTRDWLVGRLADAHQTVAPLVLALLPERFDTDDFSLELLALSYRAEPRLEGWEHVRALHTAHAGFYRELHGVLIDAFVASTALIEAGGGNFRKLARPEWPELQRRARRLLRRSRWRGYLRWPRIILTEPNLVDLAINEAERKAGVRLEITPKVRRHPFIYGLPHFLRVLRERKTQERIKRNGRGRP
jgi:hypothetical protein